LDLDIRPLLCYYNFRNNNHYYFNKEDAMLKYSRQRESIKNFLMTRKDHPTADTVYMAIREQYPNISLGTVYRNLSLLSSIGEIQRLCCGDGVDRFDADTRPHYHFICSECGRVDDIPMDTVDSLNDLAGKFYDGEIQGHSTLFYGKCIDCVNSKNIQKNA
jgi:Fur family peroxide stress response transcriptional regulator